MTKERFKIAEEKLAILYIINKANNEINIKQLSNLVLEHDLFNYFDFTNYLRDLIDSNFVDNSNRSLVSLTDFSLKTLNLLEDNISQDLKEKIDNIFEPDFLSTKNHYSTIEKIDNKYLLTMFVDQQIDKNFVLKYTLDTIEEANDLSVMWNESWKEIYYKLKEILKGSP